MNIPTRPVVTENGTIDYACTQDVSDALGVTITPVFIVNTLKVPTDYKYKNASYWLPTNVGLIKSRLIDHLSSL
jgi:hypothetical protein